MAKLIQGERVGRLGRITLGCCATIFNPERDRVLLTRRTDNGRWCLPGGRMDPGESVAETCARELREETGLEVRVLRLIGIYSSPDYLLEYADGERCHIVGLNFEAEPVGGELMLSDETTEFGYYSLAEIQCMDVMENHLVRIMDAFSGGDATFVR